MSTLPLLPLLMFFICMCHSLISNFIRGSILSNYVILTATHLKSAWNFLFYKSGDVPENDEQISIIRYERTPGSEGAVECAVCLCKIEEGEEIKELRCGHLFHSVCLDRWLGHRHGTTCPLCRDYLAPRRMAAELGEEVIKFKFCSFSSSDQSSWWLR